MSRSAQAALLQGLLVGTVMREDLPLKIQSIEQETDEDGVYLNSFVLVLFSGKRLRVTVEDDN